jgi:small-conductance mechanosensitive channel
MTEQTLDWLGTLAYAVMPWMVVVAQVPWLRVLFALAFALLAILILHGVATRFLIRLTAPLPYSSKLVQYGHRAGGMTLYLFIAQVILRNAPDTLTGIAGVRHLSVLGLITALTWLGVRSVRAVAHAILERNPVDRPDNLQARRIHTQTRVFARFIMAIVILVGSSAALMTLPLMRQIGTSLLASAGVAGLVVGFAAKPVLGNLLAGMQIALTQPIRLDDVVIVQGEWGQIEEITGTYVVVRIWDQRRMIIPLQWFIENPFQNWTRSSSDILGVVLIWADYSLPLEPLRREAERLCEEAPEWDRRLCLLQVVDASERAMQLRLLVSAGDSSLAWDLRCRLREGLINFVQREYPDHLPHIRAEMTSDRDPR